MSTLFDVAVDGGKYRFVYSTDKAEGVQLFRHDEYAFTFLDGGKALIALCCELERLREQVSSLPIGNKPECCGQPAESVTGYDNPDTGIAYNVYICDQCGALAREDVWKGAGVRWLRSRTP